MNKRKVSNVEIERFVSMLRSRSRRDRAVYARDGLMTPFRLDRSLIDATVAAGYDVYHETETDNGGRQRFAWFIV